MNAAAPCKPTCTCAACKPTCTCAARMHPPQSRERMLTFMGPALIMPLGEPLM
jgi:hypothetical protein